MRKHIVFELYLHHKRKPKHKWRNKMKIEKIIVEREDGKKMIIRKTDTEKPYPMEIECGKIFGSVRIKGIEILPITHTLSIDRSNSIYRWTPAIPDGEGGLNAVERTEENILEAAANGIIIAEIIDGRTDADEILKAQEAEIRNISLWLKGEMFGYDIEGENGIEDSFEGFTDIVSATEYLIGWFGTEY